MRQEIEEATEILRVFGQDGCKIMDSGGKDSTVLKYIAELCRQQYGLQYSVHHNHTTIDAPETVYFIRDEKRRLESLGVPYEIHYPEKNFDRLCLEYGMLPTRIARFCCKELKESYGSRERVITGVRKAESNARKKNQGVVTIFDGGKDQAAAIEGNEAFSKTEKGGAVLLNYDNAENVSIVYTCFRTNKVLVNPLINWTDDDVWRCIKDNGLQINPLYDCGFNRVGCVGCPMGSYKGRAIEFQRYPKFKYRYINIAEKIVQKKKNAGLKKSTKLNFRDGRDYFRHWIEDPNCAGQLRFDEFGNITEEE